MKNLKGENLCNAIIGKSDVISVNGADKLRKIVAWLNKREEGLNENKNHLQLIIEYNKSLKQ